MKRTVTERIATHLACLYMYARACYACSHMVKLTFVNVRPAAVIGDSLRFCGVLAVYSHLTFYQLARCMYAGMHKAALQYSVSYTGAMVNCLHRFAFVISPDLEKGKVVEYDTD